MKAILIDPSKTPAISELEIPESLESGDALALATIQELLGGYFESHQIGNGDSVLVNEDWNLQKSPQFKGRFKIGIHTFGGRGLIVGNSGGNARTPLLKASQLVTIISKS